MIPQLIIGLGNPGAGYMNTRHNAGIRAVREWAAAIAPAAQWGRDEVLPAEILPLREKVAVFFPLTFMNRSGAAAAAFMQREGISPQHILVVHDDTELAFGRVQQKAGGSARGHNGVKSIIQALGTDAFPRLRLGVGRPGEDVPLDQFVLERFTGEEERQWPALAARAGEALSEFVG